MHPYKRYYIKVREGDCKEIISDLIGGEFSTVEAINRFMNIHFPENRAYPPLRKEPGRVVRGKWYNWYSVNTDIGKANKLWVMFES